MSHQCFPYPSIEQPLDRLHIYDGLMMNASRWRIAHEYHDRRQSIHYQSINQPGIVWGLGVKKLDQAPEGVPKDYQDQRWLEVQPGLAIDVSGNPIIVNEQIAFRVDAEAPERGAKIVHLVLSYVEPRQLDRQCAAETSVERYRIDEKVVHVLNREYREYDPLTDRDIELCRLQIESNDVTIQTPKDVLSPGVNDIDLRYRIQAQIRPQAVVQVAQVSQRGIQQQGNLSYLMQSVSALYPSMQGLVSINEFTLQSSEPSHYDLIYLSEDEFNILHSERHRVLREYLKQGTTIVVELETFDQSVRLHTIQTIENTLSVSLKRLDQRRSAHVLCTTPFLFDQLPVIQGRPVQFWVDAGVIVIEGRLSNLWGLNSPEPLARHTIRSAQELGINLLSFAWRRHQLTQLLR